MSTSCTHEMKAGNVVTVINAGGWSGGCSICRSDKVAADLKEAIDVLEEVMSTDSDMPSFDDVQDRAEAVLTKHGRTA